MYFEYHSTQTQRLSLILSFSLSLGLTGISLLCISPGRVLAQMPSVPTRISQRESTSPQVKVLFVNPTVGNNTLGNGSESAPLQTITQALRVASANTVIMLSPGTYTAETGEVFPLKLKPGVAIQGDTRNKGRGIIIQGGGEFLSRSFGGQNVAIIGADQAELRGVTVTNPNTRGYGLWMESSDTVITDNTFTGSTQDGISLTGNSAPTISNNYFYRNGANGMTIGGNSQPQVQENVFQQTGFGINITQNAAPVIVGNQIQYNRSGVIVQANARPILRNNLIQGSREDGLVAIAQSIPNLGTVAEPGGNEFRNNMRYDINASATEEIVPAAGNKLLGNRIAGKVDFNAQTAPMAINPQPSTVANAMVREIPRREEITLSAVTQPQEANQSQINYVKVDPNVVEFVAPQSQFPNPLAITSPEPPFGESPLPPIPLPNGNTGFSNITPDNRVQPGVRYRVVVNTATNREQDMVKNLIPEAFPTISRGRRVMQVGVFSDRHNADQIRLLLNSNGLNSTIEQL